MRAAIERWRTTASSAVPIEPAMRWITLMAAVASAAPSRPADWNERVHEAVLAGTRGPRLARLARSSGERAFALLEDGLAGYAVKR
jgi:hypothetical protein